MELFSHSSSCFFSQSYMSWDHHNNSSSLQSLYHFAPVQIFKCHFGAQIKFLLDFLLHVLPILHCLETILILVHKVSILAFISLLPIHGSHKCQCALFIIFPISYNSRSPCCMDLLQKHIMQCRHIRLISY